MLSDRERTRLLDIERQIQSEDPDFARSFQAIRMCHPRQRLRWWMCTSAMTFTVLMILVMLLAALPVGALIFGAGTWGIVVARRAHATSVPNKDAVPCIPDAARSGPETQHEANPTNRPHRACVSDRGVQAPIVVGVDGSPAGQDAVVWAAGEAAARRRPLRIVHAIRPPSMTGPVLDVPVEGIFRAAAEALLDQAEAAARSAAPGLEVHVRLVHADAPQALLEQSRAAELLVLGSDRHGLTGQSVGLVAFELATGSSCPVVIMGPRSAKAAQPSAGRVVVGVDDWQLCSPAVEFAFQTAARRGVGITGVHAWNAPIASYADCDLASAMTELSAAEEQRPRILINAFAQQRRNFPQVDVEMKLVRANPAHALVTESAGAELVVVGSTGQCGGRVLRPGSVRRAVLSRADCSVAVVPPKPKL